MLLNPKLVGWFSGERGWLRLAAVVIMVGALLRFALAALSHPASDSCWHLSVARFIAENGRIPLFEQFGISDRSVFSAPPLFHLVAAFVYRLFGLVNASEFAVKLVSALFGSLTLPVVFLAARKAYGSRIAFFATFFVAFLPLHINSSVVSFVDSLAVLLAVLVVYFLLLRRILLSAVFLGLALTAKQTMMFFVPFFIFAVVVLYRARPKAVLAKLVASGAVAGLIGLPWLVRNYLLLGNPLWPFLYKILGGKIVPESLQGFSLAGLFSFIIPARFFLELLGAPLGSLAALSFVSIPFANVAVAAWLALTVLFILPAVAGLFARIQYRIYLFAWLALFLLVTAIYVMNVGVVSARFFLPAVPALAVVWAFGIDSMLRKASGIGVAGQRLVPVAIIILVGCAAAFSAVESGKVLVAARSWSAYDADFSWVRENTPSDALIAYRGQCMSYNVHRHSNFDLAMADYAWVNHDFKLEPVSILEPAYLQEIEDGFVLVYENAATGTKVYGRK